MGPVGIQLLFAGTIFSSAFLLFLVQPLIAKQILPWFGGSAAVWSICMVFFQVVLLAGYAYSDWVTRRLSVQSRLRLHAQAPRNPVGVRVAGQQHDLEEHHADRPHGR